MDSELLQAVRPWVLGIGVFGISLTATTTDLRARRIPNWLTIGGFVLGLVFRGLFDGWPGLGSALGGFLIGFGTLFVLWSTGGGAAGDVKLMGALSVWLGASDTMSLLMLSAPLALVIQWLGPLLQKRAPKLVVDPRKQPAASATESGPPTDGKPVPTLPGRRVTVAFAVPLGLATWIVLGATLAGHPIRLFDLGRTPPSDHRPESQLPK